MQYVTVTQNNIFVINASLENKQFERRIWTYSVSKCRFARRYYKENKKVSKMNYSNDKV